MSFAVSCRHFGIDNKLIEEGHIDVIVVRERHRDTHFKCAIVGRCHRIAHHGALISYAVSPPPPTLLALSGVHNTGSLHGHTGVTAGRSRHNDGVAGGISFFVFVNFDLEIRPFILFYMHYNDVVFAFEVGPYSIASRQSALRKGKVGRQRAVVVSAYCLLDYVLIIGIQQRKFDASPCQNFGRQRCRNLMPCQSGHMNCLPGTIY